MSIVLFCVDQDGVPRKLDFEGDQFIDAMNTMAELRAAGMRHVCMSNEPAEMVGKLGVDAVVDGKNPDGSAYDWSKQGRAGRMKAADHEKTARDGSKE